MALEASVIQYEDVVNSAGEILTKYIVHVKINNTTYNISKRYSEFKTLFEIMKDMIPPDYRFPNKSLFHNSAQATKDRRVRGFDQLLQILLSRKPVPTVMERFLGINERKSKSLQIRSKSLTLNKHNSAHATPSGENTPTGNDSGNSMNASGTDENANNNDATSQVFTEQNIVPSSQGSHEKQFSLEKYELIRSLRRETPNLITSSLKGTSATYIVLVLLRLIDISNSDFYEILVTMCVLSFVVAFVRLNLLKHQMGKESKNGGGEPLQQHQQQQTLGSTEATEH